MIARIRNSDLWWCLIGLLWAFAPAMGLQALIWAGVPIQGEDIAGDIK